ncbi:MAG: diguanylate cyclase [Bacteriovoracia bacterium]
MQSQQMKVLIIERDKNVAEQISELINDVIAAQVDSASFGEQALEHLAREAYQLVVVDVSMSDIEGLAILGRVKQLSPTTAVIVTSQIATIEEAVKAIRLGADDYFQKPLNMDQFKLSVRRSLDRRDLYTKDAAVTGLLHLLSVCQLISASVEEQKIFEMVLGYLRREVFPQSIAIFRLEGEVPVRVSVTGEVDTELAEMIVGGQNILKLAYDEKASMKIVARTNNPEIVVFQFTCLSEQSYFVVCVGSKWRISSEKIDGYFKLLQAQIQMSAKNIQNYKSFSNMLYLDEPTGLGNTRYMHYSLEQVFNSASKNKDATFSILFLDVDKFKSINDNYGHLIGTRLLFEMGQILKENLRKNDKVFRYGGDEFVVLLPGCPTTKALEIAEKIRLEVEKHVFLKQENLNIHLTVSVGVANCPDHATTKRDVIHAADNAMYAVKKSSRNSVTVASKKAA